MSATLCRRPCVEYVGAINTSRSEQNSQYHAGNIINYSFRGSYIAYDIFK